MTITFEGKPIPVMEPSHITSRLFLEERGRHEATTKIYQQRQPMEIFKDYAASGRVEDLLPVVLVDQADTAWGVAEKRWALQFHQLEIADGELVLVFRYSEAKSKVDRLHRCLDELDWSQRQNVNGDKQRDAEVKP